MKLISILRKGVISMRTQFKAKVCRQRSRWLLKMLRAKFDCMCKEDGYNRGDKTPIQAAWSYDSCGVAIMVFKATLQSGWRFAASTTRL